jgi:hypothetical protein
MFFTTGACDFLIKSSIGHTDDPVDGIFHPRPKEAGEGDQSFPQIVNFYSLNLGLDAFVLSKPTLCLLQGLVNI